MSALLAWLASFLTQFGYALIKGARSGDLDSPPVRVHEALPDPTTDAEVEDAIDKDIDAGLVPRIGK